LAAAIVLSGAVSIAMDDGTAKRRNQGNTEAR
jgi:hypothetical protein